VRSGGIVARSKPHHHPGEQRNASPVIPTEARPVRSGGIAARSLLFLPSLSLASIPPLRPVKSNRAPVGMTAIVAGHKKSGLASLVRTQEAGAAAVAVAWAVGAIFGRDIGPWVLGAWGESGSQG
jgi:hypothetical protein